MQMQILRLRLRLRSGWLGLGGCEWCSSHPSQSTRRMGHPSVCKGEIQGALHCAALRSRWRSFEVGGWRTGNSKDKSDSKSNCTADPLRG